MELFKFKYTDRRSIQHMTRNKECFGILAFGKRTELIKRIQRIGKRSYRKYVTIKLDKDDYGKIQKRKIRVFHEEFIKNTKGPSKKQSWWYQLIEVKNIVNVIY